MRGGRTAAARRSRSGLRNHEDQLRRLLVGRRRATHRVVAAGQANAIRVEATPLPFIPAHSASKTRVNALILGIHSRLIATPDLGPRFRGDERTLERLRAVGAPSRASRES